MFDLISMTELQNEILLFKAFQPDPTGRIEVLNKTLSITTDLTDVTVGQLLYGWEFKNTQSEDPSTYFRIDGKINFQGLPQAITAVRWLRAFPIPDTIL